MNANPITYGNLNVDEENNSLLAAEVNPLLSLRVAIKESAYFAIPFALSRVAIAIQNLGNGIVIAKLHIPAAVSASPVMFMIYQFNIGAVRGALSFINTVVGDLNGQERFAEIGPAVNQGLLMGTVFGVPITALFFVSHNWLPLLGMDVALVEQASVYLRAISYGIVPTYWAAADQQFLLAIKRGVSPIALNTLWVLSSMVIGYPLAIYNANLAWLGYGISIGAVITFLVGRSYLYFNAINGTLDRVKYNLFSTSFKSGTSTCELISLSFPTMLQAISEWLPTTLIAILSARLVNGKAILSQEQPSMQMLLVLIQILLGLGTAATVSVSNALGKARICDTRGENDNAIRWVQNARTIGYAELIVTVLLMLPPAMFCVLSPDSIIRLFGDNEQQFSLARSMLQVTGAALVLDGVRNTATGILLGKKCVADNFFTSITNILITSAAATTAGYFTQTILGPLSFFIFRMIGIFINAALLLHRWNDRSKISAFTFASGASNVLPTEVSGLLPSNTVSNTV